MVGYTRQSEDDIVADALLTAAPLNDEFNRIELAMSAGSGHDHDGSAGEGKPIDYTNLINKQTLLTLSSATPASLEELANAGAATSASRADHVHPYPTPAQIGAATAAHTHSAATTTVAGFMSAADRIKYNTIATGAQPGTVTNVATGTGLTGGPITLTGTISIDTALVPRKTIDNDWESHVQSNMILMGESHAVVAKGSVSGSVSCDLATGSFFTMTVGASSTNVTFTNAKSGRGHVVFLLVNFTTTPTFSITGDLMRGSPAPFAMTGAATNSQAWSTSGTDLLMCVSSNGGTSWIVVRLAASPT